MQRFLGILAVIAILALTAVGCTSLVQAETVSTGLAFDVAEDFTRFVFDENIVHAGGEPAYGGTFITQGYIYPAGTLDGTNGVLADGSPEFPDLVLGEWTCQGWFVGNGMSTESGPVAITTQIFQFGEEYGGETVVTTGYEPSELLVPVKRAITGGTGQYLDVRGEVVQQLLGMTDTMAVNLRFEFHTR
jgi:hypothetical protein